MFTLDHRPATLDPHTSDKCRAYRALKAHRQAIRRGDRRPTRPELATETRLLREYLRIASRE
jgi:hypothetical protein